MDKYYCSCGRELIFIKDENHPEFIPSTRCECGCVYLLASIPVYTNKVIKISDEKGIQE